MSEKGVRRAPIIDDDQKICGLVAVDDLINLLSGELSGLSDIIKTQLQFH
jgi:predicted transcriptional regulator